MIQTIFQHHREAFGTWVAIKLLLRRRAAVLGYLFLTAAVIYALAVERDHSAQGRRDLALQQRTVLVAGCNRQNVLRTTLQDLVQDGIPQIQKLVREGRLTPAQGQRQIAASRTAIRKLAPTDCEKAYPAPKV